MATWQEFEAAAPEMATAGRALIYRVGIGLGYLATVRADGGPRLHPFCPIIAAGGLWAFIIDSPKRRDLLDDGRYALHSFPAEEVDDEFYLTGTVEAINGDPALHDEVAAVYRATGGDTNDAEQLFAFDIEHAMLATYKKRPDWPPTYTHWHADG
ncbi:MAG: hypothetical protein HYX53_13225 [Chloroflexi bacterium]|nr:hypothetical protein [Chloroflexota bacterium]